MKEIKKTVLASVILSAMMTACGGGGSSSADSGSGNAPSVAFYQRSAGGVEVGTLDCSGASCKVPASASGAASGSVYRYSNTTGRDQTLQLTGPVTSAWQAEFVRISGGDTSTQFKQSGSGLRGAGREVADRLEAESQAVLNAVAKNSSNGALQRLQLQHSAKLSGAQAALQQQAYALGDARTWHDMDGDSPTTLKAVRDLPNGGGKVYVWGQSGLDVGVDNAQADALAERFAGSVYPLEASVVSEPWGNDIHPSWRSLALPGSTKDVHLVLSRLNDPAKTSGGRLLGYVRWTNALLASAASSMCQGDAECADVIGKSNQALVTFIDLDTFAKADSPGNWSMKDNGPSLALSTMAHEYLHVLYAYNKILRQKPGSAPTTVWENELAAQTMGYLVSADTYTGGRGRDANSHPDLRPRGDFEQFLAKPACNLKGWSVAADDYTCYPKALALGMQMLHQFGPGVMKPWVTGPSKGESALNDGLRAVGGGDYGSLLQRLTTTLALGGYSQEVAGFGFPAKTITLPANQYFPAGKTLQLPAVRFQASEVGWRNDSSQETWRQPLAVSRGAARITVPANSHLLLVKS
ncbi:M30 family zinc metallopeptidase [Chromobacterium violaceum]